MRKIAGHSGETDPIRRQPPPGVCRGRLCEVDPDLDAGDLIHSPDRGEGYTILELVMFAGRTEETKRTCLRRLMADLPVATGIPVGDLEIVILESPRANWGIPGLVGDELQLSTRSTPERWRAGAV